MVSLCSPSAESIQWVEWLRAFPEGFLLAHQTEKECIARHSCSRYMRSSFEKQLGGLGTAMASKSVVNFLSDPGCLPIFVYRIFNILAPRLLCFYFWPFLLSI